MPQWFQILSAVLGLMGTVLGFMSTWSGLTRDKPKVLVRALWFSDRVHATYAARIVADRPDAFEKFPDGNLGVEVVNAGLSPVYICEVGVCPWQRYWLQRFRKFDDPAGRAAVYQDAEGEVTLPYKLEPGTRMRLAFNKATSNSPAVGRAGLMYARTEDDRLFTGTSELLREVVKAARNAAVDAD